MKKFFGRLFGILVLLAIVAGVGYLVYKRLNKPPEEIQTKELPTVTVTKLSHEDISTETSLMGTIQPSDTYYIMPKAAGELMGIYVQNGDFVREGAAIATIDNQKQIDAARISLEQAQVQADATASALARILPLFEAGDISAQEYESTKAQADAANASVQSAMLNYNTQMENSSVIAPASGIVQNSSMTLRAMVSQSSQLCVITGTGAKTVNFNVTEDVLENLSLGQEVTVEKSGASYTGRITEIAQLVNAQTGLFPVEATLSSADRLPDGASCKVRLVSEHAAGADLIPLDCIYYSSGNPYVYVYEGGTVKRVFLTLGIENEQEAQVLEGLDSGMDIVDSWTNELYDGASVKVR